MTARDTRQAGGGRKVVEIRRYEHPNAICAIHMLPTRTGGAQVVAATHEVVAPNLRFYVCPAHAETQARWGRIEAAYYKRAAIARVEGRS